MISQNLASWILVVIISLLVREISSYVLVYNLETHNLEVQVGDVPSRFGAPIPYEGLRGLVVYSNPPNACVPIERPPVFENFTGKWIVLIKRYGCQFEEKIRNAQKAGFDAAIVHNVNSTALEPMAADNPFGILIPSVFIGSDSGALIKENYLFEDGYYVVINDDLPFNFAPHLLLIFSVLVGLCFFVMVLFIVIKYFKERRRQRRHRLPRSSLKEIPIHKFKKNDPYEMCAICLEEYVENEKLRVLPCSHAYHSKCIDPWLTKNRRVCPVCKRRVFASGETMTDTDSDTDDETSPLMRNNTPTTNAGPARRYDNPFHQYRRQYGSTADTGVWASSGIRTQSSSTSSSSTSNVSPTGTFCSMPEDRLSVFVEDERNLIEEPSINATGSVEITSASNSLPSI